MNNAYLIDGLEQGPRTIALLMEQIPASKIDQPTGHDRFSPREVIAHMADWEPRLGVRIEAALAGPGRIVPVWDEGELAIENRYAESDWRERMEAFLQARRKTIDRLKGLRPEDWDRTFVHPERGEMKVEDQAAFFLGHDLYHVEQLTSVLD